MSNFSYLGQNPEYFGQIPIQVVTFTGVEKFSTIVAFSGKNPFTLSASHLKSLKIPLLFQLTNCLHLPSRPPSSLLSFHPSCLLLSPPSLLLFFPSFSPSRCFSPSLLLVDSLLSFASFPVSVLLSFSLLLSFSPSCCFLLSFYF
jgi:hypothetical protein